MYTKLIGTNTLITLSIRILKYLTPYNFFSFKHLSIKNTVEPKRLLKNNYVLFMYSLTKVCTYTIRLQKHS